MKRAPRALDLDSPTRAALGDSPTESVNLDRLQSVEGALGIEFADDVLALFACQAGALAGFSVGRVIANTGSLHALGVRGNLVAIGELPNGLYVCVELRAPTSSSQLILVDTEAKNRERRIPLIEWLGEHIRAPTGSFSAELIRPRPESTEHGRRVRHKVFGDGRLLAESGRGPTRKVKVDFAGHGLKTLQARFLEFPDEPA